LLKKTRALLFGVLKTSQLQLFDATNDNVISLQITQMTMGRLSLSALELVKISDVVGSDVTSDNSFPAYE